MILQSKMILTASKVPILGSYGWSPWCRLDRVAEFKLQNAERTSIEKIRFLGLTELGSYLSN